MTPDPVTGASKTPIYQTAAFAHDTAQELEDIFNGREYGYYYSRVNNPTISVLEQRISALDKGLGSVAVSSGMSAIATALLTLAHAGSNIVCSTSLFGSTYYLLQGLIQNCGIEVRFADPLDLEALAALIDDKTALVYTEAIGNPKLDVVDLQALSSLANTYNIPLVVDNTFVTAYLLDAKKFGVNVVVNACTKYLCGRGSTIGGAITDLGNFDWKKAKSKALVESLAFGKLAFLAAARKTRSNLGNCLAPFNAYLIADGLETLSLRLDKHCENACKVAAFLESHPKVKQVNYIGLKAHAQHELAMKQFSGKGSGMLTIRVGSKDKAYTVIDNFKLVSNLVNLGDSKTLAVYPATTIYRNLSPAEREKAGVYDDLIRVSIGLENANDISRDFEQALNRI
jgi:O-acetylhomoserine (thiol)-lyase